MSRKRYEGLRDRGAAAVEMALVLPLLCTMLFGVIDFGRLFNAEIQLSQAAREGARIAALGPTAGDPVARAQAAAPDAGFGGAGGPVTATALAVCTPTSPPTDDGVVRVTFHFQFYVLFIPDRDIRQTARMRCGG